METALYGRPGFNGIRSSVASWFSGVDPLCYDSRAVKWDGFKQAAPELAERAEQLFEKAGVVLVGTVRKDGSPRISPVEALVTGGELYLGMMWRSFKALDLLRDPRCTVHNAIRDRFASEGEFKLHGRAVDVEDLEERTRYGDALYKKIGWKPEEPKFHLFSIDIESAALFVADGNARLVKRWRAGESVEAFRQTI
jgi:predicted pyridoxine 5'-phosphate oxidase superfamily flavin-nucleotide-binding protein